MESADLRVFQMVAREGSITKAAARLGYVQSNVTARVKHLEKELGTELFFRHNRGMTLTPNGKSLLTYADKIMGLLDEAAKAISPTSEPSGPLLIGSTQTNAAVRLPKLLASYYEKYPDVLLSLTTGHSNTIMEKVLHYELDGAFIACTCDHPELQTFPAFQEELVIVTHSSVTNLQEAITKPILVYSTGCSYRHILEQWLLSSGYTESVIMEFGTLDSIIGGVTAGLGISLLPRVVTKKLGEEGLMRTYTIPESYSRIETLFVTRKNSFHSSALSAFVETLNQVSEAT